VRHVLLCESLVPKRHLIRRPSEFVCPYCGLSWRRGGYAEGFRKASGTWHVTVCWEILVFQAGYLVGDWHGGGRRTVKEKLSIGGTVYRDVGGGHRAIPIDVAAEGRRKLAIRRLKHAARVRRRAGLELTSPAPAASPS
jgi:hypothetical protein